MLKIKSLAVIGGDLRQKYLAEYLIRNGYHVNTFSDFYDGAVKYSSVRECIRSSDGVILPLPITKDHKIIYSNEINEPIPVDEVLNDNLRHRIVFGGKADAVTLQFMEENEVVFYDYFKMEDMTVKNAFATAEGAIAIAIQNTRSTLFNSDILIAGYGRIGRALTQLLVAFGARVSVVARSASQSQWAKLAGANVLGFEELKQPCHYDIVFNTVPHIVFTKAELSSFDSETLMIDLASFPGGIDLHQANTQGIKVITASALPSRFAPKSSGEFIAQSIIHTIKEEV